MPMILMRVRGRPWVNISIRLIPPPPSGGPRRAPRAQSVVSVRAHRRTLASDLPTLAQLSMLRLWAVRAGSRAIDYSTRIAGSTSLDVPAQHGSACPTNPGVVYSRVTSQQFPAAVTEHIRQPPTLQ
jgi:hypothetical protein